MLASHSMPYPVTAQLCACATAASEQEEHAVSFASANCREYLSEKQPAVVNYLAFTKPAGKLMDSESASIRFPNTAFMVEVDNRVFQGIVANCLSKVEGVSLPEGNLLDQLLGRGGEERATGIYVEQDEKNRTVTLKIELQIIYGVSLPQKAEELQTKIASEITQYTGMSVASVHISFRGLVPARKDDEKEDLTTEFKPVLEVQEQENGAKGSDPAG